MKHPSTRAVFAHWNERRGNRPAPERVNIDPVAIRHALGDTFLLAVDFVDQHRFRLAGTRLCALFCRELKGESFSALWSESSRQQIDDLLTAMTEETAGAVAGLTGRTADGAKTDLELLLLPLARQGHARIRALGVLAPAEIPYWIGEHPVGDLELDVIRHIGPEAEPVAAPRLVPAAAGSRVRHGFVVYAGGREPPSGRPTD